MNTPITKNVLMRSKKVRIFYSIVDSFPPYRVDVAELFGRCLVNNEIEIEWYMSRDKPGAHGVELFEGQKVNLPSRLTSNGFMTKVANKFSYWLCDMSGLIKCLFKPLDLIQVRDKYFSALTGLFIARMKGIKFVYWCSYPFPEHDLESALIERGIRRYIYLFRGWFGKLALYHVVLPFSDHIFVQSGQMKRDIAAYGVPEEKMTPVPMGVPDRIFTSPQVRDAQIQPGQIVYIGTLAAVRRMHVLIEAFAEVHASFPDARLVIVGDGDTPWERASLEQLVHRLGLAHVVRFTGFLPIDQAWAIAAAAQFCVSPIYPTLVLNAGSPTKLVEYMALGRPVVCNDHPEQSEIIKESGAGLCVPWGVKEFAGAMAWMLEHPEEAEAMGVKGSAWVAAHRTYPIIAENVWRKYQEILQVAA